MDLEAILIPLGVCVALPVLIVWLVYRSRTNKDNRRAEVLIEAIKANGGIVPTSSPRLSVRSAGR